MLHTLETGLDLHTIRYLNHSLYTMPCSQYLKTFSEKQVTNVIFWSFTFRKSKCHLIIISFKDEKNHIKNDKLLQIQINWFGRGCVYLLCINSNKTIILKFTQIGSLLLKGIHFFQYIFWASFCVYGIQFF